MNETDGLGISLLKENAYQDWQEYYSQFEIWRGTLHAVLDDGNMEDAQIDNYLLDFAVATSLLNKLRLLTVEERMEVFDRFWDEFHAHPERFTRGVNGPHYLDGSEEASDLPHPETAKAD